MKKESEHPECPDPQTRVEHQAGTESGASQAKSSEVGEGESISAKELAILAATIAPEDCMAGRNRAALYRASALLDDAKAFSKVAGNIDSLLDWLFQESSPAIDLILNEMLSVASKPASSSLRLELDGSRKPCQVREYLTKNANRQGKKGAWKQHRTIWNNFESKFIDEANRHNFQNLDTILIYQTPDGRTEGAVPSEGIWRDGIKESKAFKRRCQKGDGETVSHYEIPLESLRELCEWLKASRREKLPVSKIQVWTREDILAQRAGEKYRTPKRKQ